MENKQIEETIEKIAQGLSLLGFEPTDETHQAEYYRILSEALQSLKSTHEEEAREIFEKFEKKCEEILLDTQRDFLNGKLTNIQIRKVATEALSFYFRKSLQSLKSAHEEEVKEEIEKYKEALIWCSGSEDFQYPDGKARVGWEKIVQPLLKKE